MPQRAGVLLNSGNFASRVSDEMRLIGAKRFKLRLREETPIGQHDVERFDGMSLALDISITIRIGEGIGGNPQYPVVQHIQNVDAGQASAGVARTRMFDDFKNAAPIGD